MTLEEWEAAQKAVKAAGGEGLKKWEGRCERGGGQVDMVAVRPWRSGKLRRKRPRRQAGRGPLGEEGSEFERGDGVDDIVGQYDTGGGVRSCAECGKGNRG